MNDSNDSDAIAELLTLTVEVDQWGSTYRNSLGLLHRIHGPAIELANGTRYWLQYDQLHRTDGPAIECVDGKWWYQNDQLHRTDGPAVEMANGTKSWSLDGQQLTEVEFNERLK